MSLYRWIALRLQPYRRVYLSGFAETSQILYKYMLLSHEHCIYFDNLYLRQP